jgi:hypothetical protein
MRSRENIFGVTVKVEEEVSEFWGFDNTNREVAYYKLKLA